MPERAEFHPLAGRVTQWLHALLTPRVQGGDGDGALVQRADLVVQQRGRQVMISCVRRVLNRTAAAARLCWTIPQPPMASAHAVGVRLGACAVSAQADLVEEAALDARRAWSEGRSAVMLWQGGPATACLAAGWVPPNAGLEIRSHHFYTLAPGTRGDRGLLQIRLDASLPGLGPMGAASPPVGAPRAALSPAWDEATVAPPALLRGVIARVARQVSGGFAFVGSAGDRAVVRGRWAGCAVRLQLVQPVAPAAAAETPAACAAVESLLRAYRDPLRSEGARAALARAITAMGLQHGLITPWTALLAAGQPLPRCAPRAERRHAGPTPARPETTRERRLWSRARAQSGLASREGGR